MTSESAYERTLLRLLTAPLDELPAQWQTFVRAGGTLRGAAALQLGPPLHARLEQAGVPAADHPSIAALYLRNRVAVGHLFAAAEEVADLFCPEGMAPVALKGLALVAGGSCDPGARVMGDADLLVSEVRFRDAVELLRAAGWRQSRSRHVYDTRFLRALPLVSRSGVLVDLHARLLHQSRAPAEDDALRTRATPSRSVPGLLVPHPSDQVLHAVAHALTAHTAHLRWVADVATLVAAGGVDWPLLTAAAGRRGVSRFVGDGLAQLRSDYDIPVPGTVLGELRATEDHPLVRALVRSRRGGPARSRLDKLRRHWALLGLGAGGSLPRRMRAAPAYLRHVAGERELGSAVARLIARGAGRLDEPDQLEPHGP